MNFKDFVAFVLRMAGFWLVIDSVLGVANASFLMSEMLNLPDYNNQLLQMLIPVIVSVSIGLLLVFMPYKIANFFIFSDVEVSAVPEFYQALTRVGVALLGIYIMVTGVQYLVYELINYSYLAEQYSQFDDYLRKRNSALTSQAVRIIFGVALVLGSGVISVWLSDAWSKAKNKES